MSKVKIKLGKIFQVNNLLDNFVANADNITGEAYGKILDVQEPLAAQIEKANKVEESLKKKYPHKWNSEDPSFDAAKQTPYRIFTGERVNQQLTKEHMNEYAVKDKKSFEEEWEKYLKKEYTLEYKEEVPTLKDIIKGTNAHGQAYLQLRSALTTLENGLEVVEESK
jgi:hypothetical protein